MNRFEEKRANRVSRLKGRAARLENEATTAQERARKMAGIIPFGQPILVGHHSERRDRNYRAKIGRTFDKAHELHEKAKDAASRAHAAETSTAISSDDPDAADKLRRKLAGLERDQEHAKAINAIVLPLARGGKEGWEQEAVKRLLATGIGLTPATAAKLTEKDFAGRYGVPDYNLTNRAAEIRRVKARIEQLSEAAAAPEHEPVEIGDATVSEDRELNRKSSPWPVLT